ncbi:unnamed protein product [Paramecium octaurelia]|uniref:Uncharacterized protein n=1 Tax=Paramecium octaurelia TaxID=43137 RepID=A0A8S1Y862_PAROT|nr:unnamed protein product [Paramecium octaurelia]
MMGFIIIHKLLMLVNIKMVERLANGLLYIGDYRCKIILFQLLTNFSGGGTYEIFFTEDSIKTGKWIELSDGFNDDQQITYVGEYSNNKKFGKWDSFYRFYLFEWKKIAIGGGSYDDNVLGDSVKFGEWVEQSEGFNWNSYVTYHGIYKNGKKSGEWKACWRSYFEKWSFNVIGEGSYDDSVKGDSVKIGWSDEQSEGYQRTSQVTYQGDYNNGMKVGKWNIKFQGSNVQDFIIQTFLFQWRWIL